MSEAEARLGCTLLVSWNIPGHGSNVPELPLADTFNKGSSLVLINFLELSPDTLINIKE